MRTLPPATESPIDQAIDRIRFASGKLRASAANGSLAAVAS